MLPSRSAGAANAISSCHRVLSLERPSHRVRMPSMLSRILEPRWLATAAALAVCYWLAAKASLLLAIPPGYATAVWPPSGIALAAGVSIADDRPLMVFEDALTYLETAAAMGLLMADDR